MTIPSLSRLLFSFPLLLFFILVPLYVYVGVVDKTVHNGRALLTPLPLSVDSRGGGGEEEEEERMS